MAAEWYCRIAGREVGPLSPQQLKTMAERGQILPDDGVRRGVDGDWAPAKLVSGLLPVAPGVPPVAAPPIPAVDPSVNNGGPPAAPSRESPPVPPPVVRSEPALDIGPIRIVTEPPEAERGPFLPRWKRQREQQIKLLGALLGSILVLGVLVVFVFFGGGGEKGGLGRLADRAGEKGGSRAAGENARPSGPVHQSPETLEKLEGVIPLDKPLEKKARDIAEILGVKTDAPSNQPEDHNPEPEAADRPALPTGPLSEQAPAKPAVKLPPDEKWVDASTHAAVVRFVALRIVSAEVVPSPGGADESAARLIIAVELSNGGGRDVDFQGWTRGGVARGAKLYDDAGNVCRPKAVGRAPLPGQSTPMTIGAGRSGLEELAFEPPPDDSEYVLLELPADAFGLDGVVKMKIPAEMIVNRPPPPAEEDKPRQPKPGTPEYDFGLPEVDDTIQ